MESVIAMSVSLTGLGSLIAGRWIFCGTSSIIVSGWGGGAAAESLGAESDSSWPKAGAVRADSEISRE